MTNSRQLKFDWLCCFVLACVCVCGWWTNTDWQRGRKREGSRSLPPLVRTDCDCAPSFPTFKHGETLWHYTSTITLTLLRFIVAVAAHTAVVIFAIIIIIITIICGTVMTREDGEVVGEPVGDLLEPVGAAVGRGGQQVPSAHSGPPGPR